MDELHIFLISDNIASDNLEKLQSICDSYGRDFNVVPAQDILSKGNVKGLGLPKWNGSLVIYSKLFALDQIEFPTETVIYIDGDTIINKPLDGLVEVGVGLKESGKAIGACYDFYISEFKEIYGVDRREFFINTGMMVINQKNWTERQYLKRIIEHINGERGRYITADQDIINILFRDEIEPIDPSYNFNSGFYLYGIDEYLDMYRLRDIDYVDEDRLTEIMSASPHVNHCMVNMCGRPWEKGNSHPQNALFDEYLSLTPWGADDKLEPNKTLLAKAQFAGYKILPWPLYKMLYPKTVLAHFRNINEKYLKVQSS